MKKRDCLLITALQTPDFNLPYLCGLNPSVLPEDIHIDTVVIGASAAGLACGACLKKEGMEFEILEQADAVGSPWRSHYDRLHLHTPKSLSALPFYPIPREYPTYPSRDQVVDYMERYCDKMGLRPVFGTRVTSVGQNQGGWSILTNRGLTYLAKNLIVATGYNHRPRIPSWPGDSVYKGQIIHSDEYQNGVDFRGKDVLVVGFGNSAAEIAVCLHEHGARPSMSVRSPVNIIRKQILGIPTTRIGLALDILPAKVADWISSPLRRIMTPRLEKYGLRTASYGPVEQVKERKMVPVLDIGTLDLIKAGEVKVFGDIDRFDESGVIFKSGNRKDFDAVILGTGYTPALEEFLPTDILKRLCDPQGRPLLSGKETPFKGLYFCGFHVASSGTLREINRESRIIAKSIAQSRFES